METGGSAMADSAGKTFGAFKTREEVVVGGPIYTQRIALHPNNCITPGEFILKHYRV